MLHLFKDFRIAEAVKAIITLSTVKTPFLDQFREGGVLDQQEWIWYETFGVTDQGELTADINAAVTAIPVTEDLAKRITNGYVIMIGDEQMMVDSVNTSTNVVTVKGRGFGGTPASSHSDEDEIYVVSKAEADGANTEDFLKLVKVKRSNYLQEFTKSVYISARSLMLKHKDYASLKGEEILAKTDEQRIELTKQLIYGRKNYDGTNGRHTMAGLTQSISEANGVILDASADLTEDKFSGILVQLAQRGSNVTHILLNPASKEKLFKKFKNTYMEPNQNNQLGGGNMVGYMANAFDGRIIYFKVDTAVKTNDIFLYDENDLKLPVAEHDGEDVLFKIYPEVEDSSQYRATIRTIVTSEIRNAYKMAHISNV